MYKKAQLTQRYARDSIACMKALSEDIYSKSTICLCDFLLMVSSNRGRVTYGLRNIFACRLKIAFFAHCTVIVHP